MIDLMAFAGLLQSTSAIAGSSAEFPAYVSATNAATLQGWFKLNPGFRLALDSDCSCGSDIEDMRKGSGGKWKAQPNYHPYYVTGDFNSDGKEDFAVVLIKGSQRFVALFNAGSTRPAFMDSKYAASLFFGPPRPKPYRLVTGSFSSEGMIFEPRGSGYVLK